MLPLFRNLFAPPRHLILLVITVWLGLTLAEKRSDRHGVSKENLNNITFYSLLAYLIGGRVIFGLVHLSVFSQSPLSIFSLNPDLFEPFGAAVTAALVGAIYVQRQKLMAWSTLDSLTPIFATIAIGLALSHLAAGTAFGSPTNLPWGINLWNTARHPTQIYELIASTLIFILLWFKKVDDRPGIHFLTFTALTSASHIFIDAFRGDSILILGGFRETQLIAWLVMAVSFIAFEIVLRPRNDPD
jgi:phosphatidylglycerol:prolipoprotein diacylglycerol transferase